jgi:tetratricopeptide (TPR) repeat protein
LEPILDDDIIEKKCLVGDDAEVLLDSYKACVVYLLSHLSFAYMELRHYSDAIDCLDEAIAIAEDKVADLYFRRSQARTYNTYSGDEELDKAMKDIDKAIALKPQDIYEEHKKMIIKFAEDRFNSELEKTQSKIKFTPRNCK